MNKTYAMCFEGAEAAMCFHDIEQESQLLPRVPKCLPGSLRITILEPVKQRVYVCRGNAHGLGIEKYKGTMK